jgi:hypothetical protein
VVLTNFNKAGGLRGISVDNDNNGLLELRKGALELPFQFAVGKLFGDHIRQFRINPKMGERLDQHPSRCKGGQKEDRKRMMADEIGPPLEKAY